MAKEADYFFDLTQAESEIWTSWAPTMELRISGVGEQLQQRWHRYRIRGGIRREDEFEWRGVPRVY